jgi:hypothetical protein
MVRLRSKSVIDSCSQHLSVVGRRYFRSLISSGSQPFDDRNSTS